MTEKRGSKIFEKGEIHRPSGGNNIFEKRDGIGENPKPTSVKPGFTKPGK